MLTLIQDLTLHNLGIFTLYHGGIPNRPFIIHVQSKQFPEITKHKQDHFK